MLTFALANLLLFDDLGHVGLGTQQKYIIILGVNGSPMHTCSAELS